MVGGSSALQESTVAWILGFTSRKMCLASGSVRAPLTRNSTVPSPSYSVALASAIALLVSFSRSSGQMSRAGAISTTYKAHSTHISHMARRARVLGGEPRKSAASGGSNKAAEAEFN
jgi:hypothetical protein